MSLNDLAKARQQHREAVAAAEARGAHPDEDLATLMAEVKYLRIELEPLRPFCAALPAELQEFRNDANDSLCDSAPHKVDKQQVAEGSQVWQYARLFPDPDPGGD
jgi:hypothetical protein